MRPIKSSAMRRKNPNTTPIGKEDFDDSTEEISEVSEAKEDSVVSEDLISEILISVTLWAGFLVVDSADDREEKAPKAVKTSKWP